MLAISSKLNFAENSSGGDAMEFIEVRDVNLLAGTPRWLIARISSPSIKLPALVIHGLDKI